MRRRATRGTLALALAAVAAIGVDTPVSAAPPPPADLQVEGGEERWHPKRRFRVFWKNPAPGAGQPIVAVHYRVTAPDGSPAVVPTRIGWPATSIERVEVPDVPGIYRLEAWLEDAAGQRGAAAAAQLRFDDRRPGPVEPRAAAVWIGRADFPLTIGLGQPTGAPPASGIRGYAVSVGPSPGRHPCLADERCGDAEIDLHPGSAGYRIADLPEGASEVQAVAVSGSGMASRVAGRALLRVDETSPSVVLHGAPKGWSSHPVALTAVAMDHGSGMAPASGGVAPFTAIAIDGEAVAQPGASATATVIGDGTHRVEFYARDLAGNVDDGARRNEVSNPRPASALVRIDSRPPSVSFATAQLPAEPELIRVRVADPLSGLDPARSWIGVRRAASGDRFARLPSAPAARGELRARWDSDSFPRGEYQFRATAYDAAGNAAATTLRSDGRPMRLRNPIKAATILRAGLGSRERTEQFVRFGRGALLRGRLETAAGTPLGGQLVRIAEHGEDEHLRVATATTGPGGRFETLIAPGPSREIVVAFPGTPTLGRAGSRSLRLAVRAEVSLRASSTLARVGGRPIVFTGRVVTGAMPRHGKSVQLQFRLPGLPWREFRTIRTDRRGRFRYAYRFSDDDSRGAVFEFRAYAPAQAGWPYEPSGSRPISVRGI